MRFTCFPCDAFIADRPLLPVVKLVRYHDGRALMVHWLGWMVSARIAPKSEA